MKALTITGEAFVTEVTLESEALTKIKLPKKTAVVLFNMGGPDDQDSVKPFLFNLFSDPDIIKLPLSFLFQKLLAFIIVTARGEAAKKNYQLMGGGSPQLTITRQQADALKNKLKQEGLDLPVYVAMRYWHPFTEETVAQLVDDDIEHIVFTSLYPHYSHTTNGSSMNELKRVLKKKNLTDKLKLSVVPAYYKDPEYLKSLAGCMASGLEEGNWACDLKEVRILFSAHSLPVSHVERTNDPYPKQIENCCQWVMEQYFPDNEWDLAYQSKVGKMPWLGPGTDGVLAYYAGKHIDNILVVPISFVSDHIETLVEIDQEYIPEAKEMGVQHIHRAPVMNTRPDYIQLLARLVQEKLGVV